MTKAKYGLLAGAALSIMAAPAMAQAPKEPGGVVAAIAAGKPLIDVRYRFEWVDNGAFAQDARASTIRTRLGYETGEYKGFKVLLEFENVATIGDDRFNSTTNGRTAFPIVADPEATEINRAQATFTGIEKTAITVGRQKLDLLNQRFVGAVDFRQNQQTFDAARLNSTIIDGLSVDYLYVSRVHRIFGDDHALGEFDSDSHIFAATYDGKAFGKLSGYGLLLDFEEAPALSSSTFGLRYENVVTLDKDAGVKAGLVVEAAKQRDYAANPFDYNESYVHAEGMLAVSVATLRVGYERLGGNGAIGFSTPLATLHKFQGFADVFLTTPAAGIEDIYGTAGVAWKKGLLGADGVAFFTYHSFETERGSTGLGEEYDAGVSLTFKKRWNFELKGAAYRGDGPIANRNILWTSLRFQY